LSGKFGAYEDRGELGRGGMARVHRLHDATLGREVAGKWVPEPIPPDAVEVLLREARITGQLEHASIPPVHAACLDGSTPFFTMRLLDGQTLRAWRARHGASLTGPALADGLEIVLKVLDAVAFAHARGVLHRDIKPDNVLVGAFGEVHLMDWGLAVPTAEAAAARPGGTPSYMAPEQARGAPLDERADVYGLGALLYFLVAGRAPNRRAGGINQVIRGGCDDLLELGLEPVPPSALVAIIRRAMSPRRQDRHASALELRSELRDFLRAGLFLEEITFPAGFQIIVQGEVGSHAYLLAAGRAVALQGPERRRVRELGPGDVFGELALWTDAPRTATVESITEVRAQVVTRQMLEAGLRLNAWIAGLARTMGERFLALEAAGTAREG
jgi:serine/threonine-protein kinase